MYEIKLSVRQLVEFILRSGNIDSRFSESFDRMAEGSRIHRKLQKAEGAEYRAEVTLSMETNIEGRVFIIEGRADGIIAKADLAIIDEIKTTATPLMYIDEVFSSPHWAQAMCYGYIYGKQNQIGHIQIQLRYYQIETEEIKVLLRDFQIQELEDFFMDLLNQYKKWADFTFQWAKIREEAIHITEFPFSQYRRGQRELAVATYRTIVNEAKLYVCAPTGIGKTISTIFPSIKAIGEGHGEKIFYLTAKTITRQVAEEAIVKLRGKGLRVKSITLTAKEKICFQEECKCNPEYCTYAHGHFERVNDVMYQMIHQEDHFSRAVIEQYAKANQVCPFELGLDLTLWSDIIICDYNYLFDPQAHLKRFFAEGGNYIFLIDEAHNLVDRAREMYSSSLFKSKFFEAKKATKQTDKKLRKSLTTINNAMITMRKECEEVKYQVCIKMNEEFNKQLEKFIVAFEEWQAEHKGVEVEKETLQLYFDVVAYLKIAELYDHHYVTLIECRSSEVCIKLLCIDPSNNIRESLYKGKSAIFFSATLTPMEYFSGVLGKEHEDKKIVLQSPFEKENCGIFIANGISTKYVNRENSIEPIVDYIYTAITEKKGNYIAYFPSYQYMDTIYEKFIEHHPEAKVLMQSNKMQEEQREAFIQSFNGDNKEGLLGFCVLGGIFSEGIDLEGDKLIGSIIVGVGLPQLNRELDIMKEHFNEQNQMGYEYAYQYPGMNKVLQAGGRVIRSDGDKGIILLIDERFTSRSYKKLIPNHWLHYDVVKNSSQLQKELKSFWEKPLIKI